MRAARPRALRPRGARAIPPIARARSRARRRPHRVSVLDPGDRGPVELELDPQVTFLSGANASGKSTLIEAIAVACGLNPEGGSRNFAFETRASHSPLGDALRLVRGARRPKDRLLPARRGVLQPRQRDRGARREPAAARRSSHYGGRSLHEQSHGQSFLALARTTASAPTASTSSTSPRPRSRRRASSRCSSASTSSSSRQPVHDRHPLADPALVPRRPHLRAVRARHRDVSLRRDRDRLLYRSFLAAPERLPPPPARRTMRIADVVRVPPSAG